MRGSTVHRHVRILAATLALALAVTPPVPTVRAAAHAPHDMPGMSDAAMQRVIDAWFARHPVNAPVTHAVATQTFTASGVQYDLDGNASTVVDTAQIFEGETVNWQWVNGSHTCTSGTGSGDPNAGVLFNVSLNSLSQTFSFTFPTAGTYPFFCVPHQGFNMRGVVVVKSLAGVRPGGAARAGFVGDPAPVPSRGGVSFRFALVREGHVRAEVFDVRGRRVSVALDRESGAGTFDGSWNGRTSSGTRATSGVYYLRLAVP
ncbi:MAG: plastocyanin/azurin family copper-binding protein, partial [Candidatus Eisenbacteria bacterium]